MMLSLFTAVIRRRDLLLLLASRDFKTRYLSVKAGAAYTLIVSFATMTLLSIVFGSAFSARIAAPYPAYVFTALIPWTFFQLSVNQSVDSFRSSASIIRKVAFPRALVPLSVVSANAINMAISLLVLLPFLLAFDVPPSPTWLALPVALLPIAILAVGVALFVSTAAVFFVEVRPAVDVVVMLWFYATPIFYPVEMVPERFRWLVSLNPLTHVLGLVRSLLLEGRLPPTGSVLVAVLAPLVVLSGGVMLLRKFEGVIADHVG